MKFTTILLDLDDTLLDFNIAEKVALPKALREFGVDPTEATLQRYHDINIAQWEAFERGALSRERVLIRRFELLFEELGLSVNAKACEDRYRHYLGVGHYFVEGAEALLEYLAPKYKLYLASNGVAETQYSRLESAGISHYFEEIFISENTGFHKPQQEYFNYCFARIPNFEPDKTLIIGDSLSSDILGGKNAGIHTCWCNWKHLPPRPDIIPDFEIHSLSELHTFL